MALLILKALHIVGFVAWFSGMFYLVRMFVYHQEAESQEMKNQFSLMQQRVYKIIMNPAMMFTFTCGIAMLVIEPAYMKLGWMHFKLTLLVLLLVYHIYCKVVMKKLAKGEGSYTSFQFRLMNEVPTLFLLGIVLLAVLKTAINPFWILAVMLGAAVLIFGMAYMYKQRREKES